MSQKKGNKRNAKFHSNKDYYLSLCLDLDRKRVTV